MNQTTIHPDKLEYRCLRGGESCRYAASPHEEREHLFESLGLLFEQGKCTRPEIEASGFHFDDLTTMMQEKLVSVETDATGERYRWSSTGEKQYKTLIRRHRLAERLLVDVLGIAVDRDEMTEGPACQLDHVLAEEVVDSICTLLGHPQQCPHGHPIPPGECCATREEAAKPFWVPLTRVKSGTTYVVHAITDEDAAEKLIRLGVSLGSELYVRQTLPALVIDCEQTTVALDDAIARHVLVRGKR